jgi:predicted acyl esterase
VSGRSYRDLDRIDGVPNPIFDLWLRHPSYDSYWRAVTPSRSEFARIDIPVLTSTGYYDSGQEGALHYFIEHVDANRRAEHYLVIGPYDHFTGQRGSVSPVGRRRDALRGYPLDPVANIDIVRLRYEWFDSIFKNAPKPEILKDRVNYEVMGANVWRHSSSLRGMGETQLRVHPRTAIVQSVDLTDRGDIDRFERGDFIDEALDSWAIGGPSPRLANAITFATAEITAPTEISGLFSGNLVFTTNKKDFDFSVSLFQVTPSGQWMHLSYFWARASYARDRAHRHLLTVGARNELSFTAGRLTSRLVEPGSRIVVTIAILKQPGEQINYGTGKDVSDESVADAGEPLRVVWSPASVIRIPITDRSPVGRKSQ